MLESLQAFAPDGGAGLEGGVLQVGVVGWVGGDVGELADGIDEEKGLKASAELHVWRRPWLVSPRLSRRLRFRWLLLRKALEDF